MNAPLRLCFLLASASIAAASQAELKLGSLFQDHMVLQRNRAVAVWGWAKPGTKISINSSWGSKGETEVDKSGKWLARLNTPKDGGGPYEVTVNGDGQIVLKDVLVGEVWICSGQSNMEMTVNKGYPPPLKDQAKEIAAANYPRIRMFNVTKNMALLPQETCGGEWIVCTPSTVGPYSAVGYFFAKKLFEELRVPIGMIHTSWGGTEVELWTSEQGLHQIKELGEKVDIYRKANAENDQIRAKWVADMAASDVGNGKWQAADLDDSDWKPAPGPLQYEQVGLQNFDGYVWARCKFSVPADLKVNSVKFNLGTIDDMDTTYVNGVQVGVSNSYDIDRKYDIPKNIVHAGENTIAIRVLDTGGPGGLGNPNPEIIINDGIVAKLTDWKFKASTELSKLPKLQLKPSRGFSWLYNGMVNPLIPFTMKGAIWYQGEANVDRAYQYRQSFPNMIRDWRNAWGLGDFPFYYVQIAPFTYGNGRSPELREAQLLTLREPNTGMAVTTDITENVRDIHPINKQDVGVRLAYWALKECYAKHKVVASGPLYNRMRIDGSKIRIYFSYAETGLVQGGQELTDFEIAGADRKFVPAKAVIDGNTVVVSADSVKTPVAVRFGWRDDAIPNLFNKSLLPASPFRTDDWPGLTINIRW